MAIAARTPVGRSSSSGISIPDAAIGIMAAGGSTVTATATCGVIAKFSAARGRERLVCRFGRPVEHDRRGEGEANHAVFAPLDDGGHQDAALETHMDLGTGRQIGGAVAHRAAFG